MKMKTARSAMAYLADHIWSHSIALLGIIVILGFQRTGEGAECAPPPADLTAWWPGEGNGVDLVGTNHGIISGTANFMPGRVGQAFSFGEPGSHIKVPATPALDIGVGGGLTIEAWIKPSDLSHNRPMVEWNNQDSGYGAHFWISPGTFVANLVDSSGIWHVVQAPTGSLILNTFQHVAVTYDKASGMARLFANGILVTESQIGTFTPKTSGDLYIGYRAPAHGETSFSGLIDELSVYKRPLTLAEIQAIYTSGGVGKCKPLGIAIQPRSQIGYWGKSITFDVAAYGSPAPTFQWLKDTAAITGATMASLQLKNLQMTDAGSYSVVVSNVHGSLISSPAILTMNPAGVSVALHAGVSIDGVAGLTYGIQQTTDPGNANSWGGAGDTALDRHGASEPTDPLLSGGARTDCYPMSKFLANVSSAIGGSHEGRLSWNVGFRSERVWHGAGCKNVIAFCPGFSLGGGFSRSQVECSGANARINIILDS